MGETMLKASKNKTSRKIKSRLHQIKEKIGEKIKFPYLLVLTIIVIIVGLFVLGIKIPFGGEETTAIVDTKIIKYLNLYYGMTNITINNKTLDNGMWKIDINGYSSDGIMNLEVWMNANDFSISKIKQNLPIPSEPTTIRKTGKEVGCSVGDKKTVDIYIDPYDPWSIKYNSDIQKFVTRFKDDIRVNYRIVSTYTYKYVSENASSLAYTALLYYECMKNENEFDQFKTCVINKYNEKKEFLNETELIKCVEDSGADKEKIKNCSISNYPTGELATDLRFAETFIGTATSPMIVIDCKYVIYPLFVENAYCYLYPKIEQCKE